MEVGYGQERRCRVRKMTGEVFGLEQIAIVKAARAMGGATAVIEGLMYGFGEIGRGLRKLESKGATEGFASLAI
ncbi:hypothetical protein MA16_Dca006679 [Dendrobium catenatum]|uniref:Uncharacterized protein n=1 Tax=Dendrobium catenatum TaxID=906689 RepID=A0A2I0X5S9_9ASPA|nr:hypothetical protein MA16_Dca006679 [Dendrobium catenatum]